MLIHRPAQRLDRTTGDRRPRSARHSSRNAIDRFSRIGLHRQQKRLLRQNRAGRHIKENGADLKAGMGLGLQPRGFGVENQQ